MRRGYAYVAVSAQKSGLSSGPIRVPVMAMPVKKASPERYRSGDAYAFDMFSQVARAIQQLNLLRVDSAVDSRKNT